MSNVRKLPVSPTGGNDPELASIVRAKGPGKQDCVLAVDGGTVGRFEDGRLNAKIGEYCGLVHGAVPEGTNGLGDAIALFRGVRRPRVKKGDDERIYVYVLNPDRTYIYPNQAKYTEGQGPQVAAKPENSVFVVYVEFIDGNYTLGSGKEVATNGKVLYWEWVIADPDEPTLPNGHKERYDERVW